MTPLCDCSLFFRLVFAFIALICFVIAGSSLIYSFLHRKKIYFAVDCLSFILQIIILYLLHITSKNEIGIYNIQPVINILHKPVFIFISISFVGLLLSVMSASKSGFIHSATEYRKSSPDDDYLLCRKAEQLQADNIRLTELNLRMKNYGEEMQAQIKQNEILKAKEEIHSGMNKLLMVSSKAIESGDDSEIEKAVAFWHQDALLLCREAGNNLNRNAMQNITSLASTLNLKLIYDNKPIIDDEKTAELFVKAACEAMINAVKHANADLFEISVTENEFSFSNNGDLPGEKISFGGGLSAIKSLADNAKYEMIAQCDEKFTLIFRKRDENGV